MVFGSLQLARTLRYQRRYTPSRAVDRLSAPPVKVAHEKHAAMAHWVIEGHLFSLGLRARGLVKLHPSAVPYVTFGLYRDRETELDLPLNLTTAGPQTLCNGRQACTRRPAAKKHDPFVSEAWDRMHAAFERDWKSRPR